MKLHGPVYLSICSINNRAYNVDQEVESFITLLKLLFKFSNFLFILCLACLNIAELRRFRWENSSHPQYTTDTTNGRTSLFYKWDKTLWDSKFLSYRDCIGMLFCCYTDENIITLEQKMAFAKLSLYMYYTVFGGMDKHKTISNNISAT